MTRPLPTLQQAKAQAQRLRADSESAMTHAKALETVAHRHGFRDWNGFHAAIATPARAGFLPGRRVSGRYLSHPFEASVVAVKQLRPGWFRLVLDLDQPIDVVASPRFSSLRRRIIGTIGPDGHSRERTSDGQPHLVLDL